MRSDKEILKSCAVLGLKLSDSLSLKDILCLNPKSGPWRVLSCSFKATALTADSFSITTELDSRAAAQAIRAWGSTIGFEPRLWDAIIKAGDAPYSTCLRPSRCVCVCVHVCVWEQDVHFENCFQPRAVLGHLTPLCTSVLPAVYFPAAWTCSRVFCKGMSTLHRTFTLAALLLQPALIIIDHGHFQVRMLACWHVIKFAFALIWIITIDSQLT